MRGTVFYRASSRLCCKALEHGDHYIYGASIFKPSEMYGHFLEEVDYGIIPNHIDNKIKPTLLHIFVAHMSHSCKPGELQILGRKNPSTCKAMNQPGIYWNCREYTR